MIVMLFVLSNCFRTPEYEFRTLSGCAVKMYQIWRFVLKNDVICLDVYKFTHQVSDVTGCQDDAQRLVVTAGTAHEFAVESADKVLTSLLVLNILEHMFV